MFIKSSLLIVLVNRVTAFCTLYFPLSMCGTLKKISIEAHNWCFRPVIDIDQRFILQQFCSFDKWKAQNSEENQIKLKGLNVKYCQMNPFIYFQFLYNWQILFQFAIKLAFHKQQVLSQNSGTVNNIAECWCRWHQIF